MIRRLTLLAFLVGLLAGCGKTNDPPTTANLTTPKDGGRSGFEQKDGTTTTRGR